MLKVGIDYKIFSKKNTKVMKASLLRLPYNNLLIYLKIKKLKSMTFNLLGQTLLARSYVFQVDLTTKNNANINYLSASKLIAIFLRTT